MLEVKLFEVRDKATFMPCIGVLLRPDVYPETCSCGHPLNHKVHTSAHPDSHDPFPPTAQQTQDWWLLRRAGFGLDRTDRKFVLFGKLDGGPFHYDSYDWAMNPRTMHLAHYHVEVNWDSLQSGAVICVETLLGERPEAKVSERWTAPPILGDTLER